MHVTTFSFLSAIVWSSALIVLTYLFRKVPRFSRCFGVFYMSLLYLFSVARMFFPIEVIPSVVVESKVVYPAIYRFLHTEVFSGTRLAISYNSILIIVWIAVSGVLLMKYAFQYHRSIRAITRYALPADERIQLIFARLQKADGKQIKISVWTCPNMDVPFGLGIFQKRIVLPEKEYTDLELRYILLHELTHFLSRDTVVKCMTSLFCILFWMNPFVYLLKKDLEQTLEIKCDLTVIEHLGAAEKAPYLQAIVDSLRRICTPHGALPYNATTLFQCAEQVNIKERFSAVMNFSPRKSSRLRKIILALVTALVLMTSYVVLPQPSFEAPKSTEQDALDFDPSNSYIIKGADGTYQICVENEFSHSISEEYAVFLRQIGFQLKEE